MLSQPPPKVSRQKRMLKLTQNLPFLKTLMATGKHYRPSHLRNRFRNPEIHYSNPQTSNDAYPVLLTLNDVCVKVASPKERKAYYSMRTRVFGQEFRGNLVKMKKDTDKWDKKSQVIVLLNTTTGQVIVGCRMIQAEKHHDYYASHEFDLTPLLSLEGKKLEISRFCIHPKHRKSIHFLLLWRGIFVYAQNHQITYLFGLPSIKTTDKETADKYYAHFKQLGYVGQTLGIPKPSCLNFAKPKHNKKTSVEPSLEVPDLYKIYIRSGAKICSTAAVDNDLKCTDFLTVLKMSELHPKYRKTSSS